VYVEGMPGSSRQEADTNSWDTGHIPSGSGNTKSAVLVMAYSGGHDGKEDSEFEDQSKIA
jgi:hypothetical protein